MVKRGRPKCLRKVSGIPEADYFKPRGIPLVELEANELKVEEVEAMRLVDYEGMEQEKAAQQMRVSRRTLARELKSARKKIADALMNGRAIQMRKRRTRMEGNEEAIQVPGMRQHKNP